MPSSFPASFTSAAHRGSVRFTLGAGLICALSALAWAGSAAAQSTPLIETLPEPPAWMVDLQGFDKTAGGQHVFTNPYLPPLTTSLDRRVGLVRKTVFSGGPTARFHLVVPEGLGGVELMLAGDGPAALAPTAFEVPASSFHDSTGKIAHFAVCDRPLGGQDNPYRCGDFDCYNLKVIAGVLWDNEGVAGRYPEVQLWSTSITVKVAKPKAADAFIDDVIVHPRDPVTDHGPVLSGFEHPDAATTTKIGGISTFHTPMIVGEGNRLLIVRFGFGSYFEWTDNAAQTHTGEYDPVYAVYDEGEYGACDVRGWTHFKPLSYAPRDAEVNQDYDFARQDFRTPSGALVNAVGSPPSAAKDIPGRYLWVDQEAKNVFFASLSQPLLDRRAACQDDATNPDPAACEPLYAVSCSGDPGCSDTCAPGDVDVNGQPNCIGPHSKLSETTSTHQGWMMMGLWTHGKMVLLDSLVNHTDFGLAGEEENHRLVTLYSSGPDVQVGAGRDDSDVPISPYGWIDTTVQFGSTEHYLNMQRSMLPRTPRDVVWQISAGSRTDELALDDLVSQRNLIFSPMNPLKEMVAPTRYYDGVDFEMRLQNASTSTRWQPPSHGAVVTPSGAADKGRLEHVAAGGIKGRGFYLYPETRLDYDIQDQPGLGDEEWLIGLFHDPRNVPAQLRRLVTLPSGAYVALHGIRYTRLCGTSGCTTLELPRWLVAGQWTHLAYRLIPRPEPEKDQVEVYQDGFLFARVEAPTGFAMGDGVLSVGNPDPEGSAAGAEGWIDELKVVEGPFSPEEVCNHARGTMIAVPHDYSLTASCPPVPGEWCLKSTVTFFGGVTLGQDAVHLALHGPGASRAATNDIYVCHVDYVSPDGVSLAEPGEASARSLRRRLLFPEGPVVWDEPRPISVANNFCLSCHEDGGQAGLDLGALTLEPSLLPAHADTRRQPLQAPRDMLGVVPEDYFGDAAPAGSSEDEMIDRFLLDGPLFRWTFDSGDGSSARNWVSGLVGAGGAGAAAGGDATIHGAALAPGIGLGPSSRGLALDLDAGQDGSADYAEVDQAFDLVGQELTLAGWFKLATDADEVCQNFQPPPGGGATLVPCTLIAKSGAGAHALWSLRLYYRAADAVPKWHAQVKVRRDGTVDADMLSAPLDDVLTPAEDDFDPAAWHHLAGVYSASEGVLELYLDGELLDSGPALGSGLEESMMHPVTLGARTSASGSPIHLFYGLLDELQVFRGRLQGDEIRALYERPAED